MKTTSLQGQPGISRLHLYLALSRTPHLLLDLATPALAALLCLGAFPAADVVALGIITAFSGYTAVYALNDLVDYRIDQELIHEGTTPAPKPDLDSIFVRHPLAQGLLSYREALFWTAGWAALALAGAFMLNPVCLFIFLGAALLEAVYCFLLRITHLRSIISGIVKTSGPVAAVFAVNPNPPLPFMACLFLWLFIWEIGGQNVPNDLSDVETDSRIRARTIPVRYGAHGSITLINWALFMSVIMSLVIFLVMPERVSFIYLPGALLSGIWFLIIPSMRLFREQSSENASMLFNRASYYPLAMLIVSLLSIALRP